MEDYDGIFYQDCQLYEDRWRNVDLELPTHDWRFQKLFQLCEVDLNESLLDIGCGNGGFLALAREKGFAAFGIDIDERAIRQARHFRNLKHVEVGKWETLKDIKGWRDFGVITLFDVLEHLSSPASLASTVFTLLKRGGNICVTVPRIDRYPRLFDDVTDYPPHHFTLWSRQALCVLLRKAGFRDIRIVEKPLMLEDFLIHVKWRTKRLFRKLRKIKSREHFDKLSTINVDPTVAKNYPAMKVFKKLIIYALKAPNWVLNISRYGRGYTIFAIAKKP